MLSWRSMFCAIAISAFAATAARSESGGTSDVRAPLDRYASCRTNGDVEGFLALHADTVVIDGDRRSRETLREQLVWERANPAMIPIVDVGHARVLIDGANAAIEPVSRCGDETVNTRLTLGVSGKSGHA